MGLEEWVWELELELELVLELVLQGYPAPRDR
jgi:hypothetical protein